MIAHKHITKIIAAGMAAAVCLCLCTVAFSGPIAAAAGETGVSMAYETELFDTSSILTVNILMDEADWNDMLANATAEEYYQCDVEIGGTTFYRVAIRPKGNTSLTSIASDPTTDRYSFKLEFDKYVDGQTCFGLDKLVLNNNYADATNMKEAIVYDMFAYLGADSSLYNYAKISVNGEYWGVYLALEAVEDSFLLRNYGVSSGGLYKPDSMQMGGGKGGNDDKSGNGGPGGNKPDNMPDFAGGFPDNSSDGTSEADTPTPPDRTFTPPDNTNGDTQSDESSTDSERPGGAGENGRNGGRGGAMNFGSSGGCDLNYTDDNLDSYSDIWDAEVTSTSKSDHKRVVAALKAAAEGTDLEEYLDIDNLLRYMAAHTFSVNLDSLSGNMAHNYYLYENNGAINLIPWDYNLAFGGMNSNDSDAVNFAIDSPFSGTQFFDKILENEEYLAKYHEYLRILSEEYVHGGVFQQTYDRIRSQIDELVCTDPNAFFTYDEYDAAAQMLVKVVGLRAESVLGQIDGTVPSTTEAQRQNSAALIDASDIDISVMGTMGGNKGGMGGMGDKREFNAQAQQTATESSGTSTDNADPADTASSADSDATGISAELVSLSDTTLVPDGQPPELPANGDMNGAGNQAGQDSQNGQDGQGSQGSQGSQNGQRFGGNGTPPEKPSGDPPSGAPGGEITQPAQPAQPAQPSESGNSSSTSGADNTASGTAETPASDGNKTPEPAGTTEAAATGKTAESAADASSDDNSTANGQPGFPGGNANNADNADNAGNAGNGNGGFGGGFPGNPGGSGSSGTSGSSISGLVPLLISAGAAAAGLLFAALFRRR